MSRHSRALSRGSTSATARPPSRSAEFLLKVSCADNRQSKCAAFCTVRSQGLGRTSGAAAR